jgi:putative transposase
VLCVFSSIKQRVYFCFHVLQERVLRWIKPPITSLMFGTLANLTRGKAELLAENALLRHQMIILRRQIKRPAYRKADILLLVLLARMVRTWKQALFLVQPETLLRWHRELFRMFWKHKSKVRSGMSRLSPETISLIQQMAANNRLWGAERIRGELLKLDIRRSQTHDSEVHETYSPKTSWWTELENVPTQPCGRDMGL